MRTATLALLAGGAATYTAPTQPLEPAARWAVTGSGQDALLAKRLNTQATPERLPVTGDFDPDPFASVVRLGATIAGAAVTHLDPPAPRPPRALA